MPGLTGPAPITNDTVKLIRCLQALEDIAANLPHTPWGKLARVTADEAWADSAEEWKRRMASLGEKLDALWGDLEYGYLIGDGAASRFSVASSSVRPTAALGSGPWHCGLCNSSHALQPEDVKHDEGCIGPAIDAVIKEWRALAGL